MQAGFDLAGIAPIAAWHDLEFSRRWVERGFGGEMKYLENPKRRDPRAILASAKSVVCVGLVYNAPLPYSTEVENVRGESSEGSCNLHLEEIPAKGLGSQSDGQRATDNGQTTNADEPRAWISRYAWGRDYHDVMRSKLEKLLAEIAALAANVETRVFVDTGPIVERAFARLSGIGWMGKNTCLINESKGSWFFLGVILTSLALEPDLPAPDRCGTCTRCLEACPTGALVEPYMMDASRCIAYFNIELKGSIPAAFRPALGANVFGCDICQDVCPWNGKASDQWRVMSDEPKSPGRPQGFSSQRLAQGDDRARAPATCLPEFQPLDIALSGISRLKTETFSLLNPPLEALASLSEAEFRRAFRHSPIKRVKYRGWLRNLSVAMGNSRDRRFVPKLEELARHPDPVVREHAAWALEKVG